MRGLMMDQPLSITSLMRHAATNHDDAEIVSRTVEGEIHRYGYGDAYRRTQQLAHALRELGIAETDRVATLAWNTYRHFELYYAISGIGAVCHMVNPRLFADQIVYILNHAEDKVAFVDLSFVEVLEAIADKLRSIENYVVMTDAAHMPDTSLPGAVCYETLIAGQPAHYDWPELDEYTASSLCYSSGTTGNPKGALYSHRSTVLHAYATCSPDAFGLSSQDVLLPVVPMFHVNAWGSPYACAAAGTKIVFPGAKLDGESVYELLDSEKVTITAGVPTAWFLLLEYMRANNKKLDYLERLIVGGSAVPRAMIEAFEEEFEVEVRHAWGMTEMSPIGSVGRLKGSQKDLKGDAFYAVKEKQGRAVFGVEMKIVGDDGASLPRDGVAFGELCVRGPWVGSGYFNDAAASKQLIDDDGWLRTGDVATIDPTGYMQIVDRSKDVIKSGGEWVSSIEIENAAVGHPAVAEAAVIAQPHDKWGERPLLLVVPSDGKTPEREDVLAFLRDKLDRISIPDDVLLIDEIPHTATGKISKATLRERFKDHKLPT